MTSLIVVALVAVLLLLALGIPIYLVLMGVASILLVAEGRTVAGLARILFEAVQSWIGWIRGGLAISGVAATAVFAAITGSSAATTMAMGTLLARLKEEKG